MKAPQPGAFYRVDSDPTIFNSTIGTNHGTWITTRPYGQECKHKAKWGSPLVPNKKIDAHKYTTEAKDLPIEACVSFWIIKFGDAPVPAIDTVEQDDLTWEIGNRLFWAGKLEHNIPNDTYTCKL